MQVNGCGCAQPIRDRHREEEQATGRLRGWEKSEGRDKGCVCQGLRLGLVVSLMAPCQCHYVGVCSGAVSAQTDVTHTFKRVSGGHPRLTPGQCQALTHGAWWGDKFVKRRISASLPHVSHYLSQSRLTLHLSSPDSLPSSSSEYVKLIICFLDVHTVKLQYQFIFWDMLSGNVLQSWITNIWPPHSI